MNTIQNGPYSPKSMGQTRGQTAKSVSRIDSRCMRNLTCRIDTTHETPDVDLASFFWPCVVAGSRLNEITVYLVLPTTPVWTEYGQICHRLEGTIAGVLYHILVLASR